MNENGVAMKKDIVVEKKNKRTRRITKKGRDFFVSGSCGTHKKQAQAGGGASSKGSPVHMSRSRGKKRQRARKRQRPKGGRIQPIKQGKFELIACRVPTQRSFGKKPGGAHKTTASGWKLYKKSQGRGHEGGLKGEELAEIPPTFEATNSVGGEVASERNLKKAAEKKKLGSIGRGLGKEPRENCETSEKKKGRLAKKDFNRDAGKTLFAPRKNCRLQKRRAGRKSRQKCFQKKFRGVHEGGGGGLRG